MALLPINANAGDWVEMELDTRAPAPPAGPRPAGNSLIWLTSLRSYQVGWLAGAALHFAISVLCWHAAHGCGRPGVLALACS